MEGDQPDSGTDARRQERAHEDIAWLTRNLKGRMMTIGYPVLFTQQAEEIKVICVRIFGHA
jgi:hypothetical protein